MAQPFEKMHIPKTKNKRIKLTDDDRQEIFYRYHEIGGVSQRALAREYSLSCRMISFILFPEKQLENYRKRIERGGSKIYYDKDKHTETMRRHRAYKKKLYEQNQLCEQLEC